MYIHTYRCTNAHWFVAAFAVGMFSQELINEIKQWCSTTYGEAGKRWRDDIHNGEVLFRDETDVTLFLLRWS